MPDQGRTYLLRDDPAGTSPLTIDRLDVKPLDLIMVHFTCEDGSKGAMDLWTFAQFYIKHPVR